MKSNQNLGRDLHFSFDVGHSSIGWAVLQTQQATLADPNSIQILGCGAVTFRADDCLASARRGYRRQRRHIRATRQRIARLKALLLHLGVLTTKQLDTPGCAYPWFLAARALKSARNGMSALLTWPELWDVLRWYAHNRGYDGNRGWAAGEEAEPEDTEKVEKARSLLEKYGTMCETVCAVSKIDPLGSRRSANIPPSERFKAQNAAFPRDGVVAEVRQLLTLHFSKLPSVDQKLVDVLMSDWNAIPCPTIKLPRRYKGGLLFGQLIPRFDNRIISKCPITGDKVPSRNTPEFLNFRWAMQLANIRVSTSGVGELRSLTVVERLVLDQAIRKTGSFTPTALKSLVRATTQCVRDNMETMLMHPDAKEGLIVDPVSKALSSKHWEKLFPSLPMQVQRHARIWLSRQKKVNLEKCLLEAARLKLPTTDVETALSSYLSAKDSKRTKKDIPLTRDALLKEELFVPKLAQRAAYSRNLLSEAAKQVMAGKHPKEIGGCLELTDRVRKEQLNRELADQTNNHLVRHRLLILGRLLKDMIKDYAGDDKTRVAQLTIEVNRDLQTMSGKTNKEKEKDMGQRLSNFKSVTEKLENVLGEHNAQITAGLIRKARVAEDLGWTCPYTEKEYDVINLVKLAVDKDHIIPYALRPSNSLDSLVVTFSEVNKWKGKRTALQFVTEEAGKPVPGSSHLSMTTPERFKKFVEKLDSFRGHEDDKKRKKRRKELLLLEKYEAKEFTPGDLTVTSQLVRLGAQILTREFQGMDLLPKVVSLPGSVTGTVRKAWNLIGCLAQANPQVLDKSGEVKSKTDIRDITHLHHALDACVLGLASHFIPNQGRVWELILKRKLQPSEEEELRKLGVFGKGPDGQFRLLDLRPTLKEQISQRLAEKRVVQRIPARMDGLSVEQNVWRVVSVVEGEATLQQSTRGADQKRVLKHATKNVGKLLGIEPRGIGKLKKLKGVLVIPDNFGLALDPVPSIIPFHKVFDRIRTLQVANANKKVRILRNGQLIRVPSGSRQGIWKIMSVKNTEAYGLAVDLAEADGISLKKGNAPVSTLIRDGLEILHPSLTGVSSCLTTSSTSTRPSVP